METRAPHLVIGLFTVIAVAAALLFALWLGRTDADRQYTVYEIGFDRPVSGLDTGNAVLFSGIRVGDVSDLRLDPDDPRLVRARIRIDDSIPVREDTRASLALANITGSMSIQLRGGSPESPRLEGDRQDPPLIMAEPSSLSSLLADGETLVGGLNQLLVNANRLLSEENTRRIERTLANLEQLSGELARHGGELDEIVRSVEQLSRESSALLQVLTRLGEDANHLVDQQGREAVDNAARAMTTLEGATRRLEQLLEQNQGTLDRGMQGFGELGPAMRELHSTLGNLSRITRQLEESPSDFLLGREPIEEFSP
ncbi:MAG: MlaD family protein [Halomonas sp.]